jgi:hypothetical protein
MRPIWGFAERPPIPPRQPTAGRIATVSDASVVARIRSAGIPEGRRVSAWPHFRLSLAGDHLSLWLAGACRANEIERLRDQRANHHDRRRALPPARSCSRTCLETPAMSGPGTSLRRRACTSTCRVTPTTSCGSGSTGRRCTESPDRTGARAGSRRPDQWASQAGPGRRPRAPGGGRSRISAAERSGSPAPRPRPRRTRAA